MAPPRLDQDLRLLQRIEDLAVEQLVAELRVEALDIAVLPRAPRLDEGRFHAEIAQPLLHSHGGEFWAVVGPDVRRRPPRQHQLGQHLEHVRRVQPALHQDGERLARELVDHAEHAELPAVMRPVLDEVVGPDMVGPLRPEPEAGPVIEPEAALFRVFSRHFQPLPPPDPLNPLGVHHPPCLAQERGDAPVAVAAILDCQGHDLRGEPLLVFSGSQRAALGRSWLDQDPAGAALRHPELGADLADGLAAAFGADQFPRSVSCRISLSSVRSDTAFLNRAFSYSSSFSRFTWSSFSPPYSLRQQW